MIIISGVSGGIGKNIVKYFANSDDIVGLYNSNKIDFSYENVITKKLDILSEKEISNMLSSLDLSNIVLVNLATVSIDGLIANYSQENWNRTFDINVRGNFLLTKHLLPFMVMQKWGRIINFSSVVSNKGTTGALAYGASKSAITGFAKGLAREYGRYNITSNILNLGFMESGLINTLDYEKKKQILDKIPSGKFGDIENIANAIKFLISSDYVNGATIDIDGGIN